MASRRQKDVAFKHMRCTDCGHEWDTTRHRYGLNIKCPECHAIQAGPDETVCGKCGRVYPSKLAECPNAKNPLRRKEHVDG